MKLITKYKANFILRQKFNLFPCFLISITVLFCFKLIIASFDKARNVNGVSNIIEIRVEYIVHGICVSKSNEPLFGYILCIVSSLKNNALIA